MIKDLRYDAIFERAASGFAFIDSKTGKFVKVNEKFCDLLGLDKDALELTTFMSVTHPEDLQEDLDNMQKLTKGELRQFSMEKRYIRHDGSLVWGNLTVAALWDEGEEPDYHLAIVDDITVRKRAEECLQKSNELLEQRVSEHTEELRVRAQELEAANTVLVEHELALNSKNQSLEELNVALKLFIQKKEEIAKDIGEDLLGTIKLAIEPSLQKLAKICPDEKQQKIIAIIEMHLKEVIKPLPRKLAARNFNLSKTETVVADLIKNGFSNKQVAEHLHIAVDTVAFHRKTIRRKLGLTNKGTPLVEFLQNLTNG